MNMSACVKYVSARVNHKTQSSANTSFVFHFYFRNLVALMKEVSNHETS